MQEEATMSIKDREAVRAFLSQNGELGPLGIAEQRERMDSLAQFFTLPDGIEVEEAAIGGVRGEWVRARRARRDAAILYLHGGGYVIGSPASHRHLVAAISEAAGLSVFVPHYRLAPEHPFPAAVEDAVACYNGLLDGGISAPRLAIVGDSAGGGLTIAALVALRDRKIPLPAAAVALSPWTDLTAGGESHRSRAARDPMVGAEGLHGMAAAYLAGVDATTPLASPLFADLKGLPPILIQVGTEEVLFSDAINLAARAEAAGVEVSTEAWGGMMHVWHIFHTILGEGRDAVARIGTFLTARIE
jgi:acetyl esterase/lipase